MADDGMIQIEALENIKSHGYVISGGDRVTVSADAAKAMCAHGWAKAVRGEVETGERRVIRQVVEPVDVTQSAGASEF